MNTSRPSASDSRKTAAPRQERAWPCGWSSSRTSGPTAQKNAENTDDSSLCHLSCSQDDGRGDPQRVSRPQASCCHLEFPCELPEAAWIVQNTMRPRVSHVSHPDSDHIHTRNSRQTLTSLLHRLQGKKPQHRGLMASWAFL